MRHSKLPTGIFVTAIVLSAITGIALPVLAIIALVKYLL
jgi:hypothetical protein